MIHSVSGVGFSHDLDVDMERYFGAGLKNGMQYRDFFQTMDTEKVIKRGLTRIGGCFETLSTAASAQKTHLFSHRMKTVTTAEFYIIPMKR